MAPLRQIEDTMDRLSKGETGIAVPATWRKDEIGDMARAVEVFKENTLKMVSLQQDHQALMVAAEEERKVALRDLARGLESCTGETIGLIVERSARIVQTAAHMGDKIDSSTARSLTIAETSSRSEEQVNSVASATEQLTASIEEIGRNVSLSAQVAEEAVLEAEEAARRIQGLAVVASQIDDVVSMINAIARQTNMLAMNATIEAARAGVAGQGFAVVAKEVKNLATQTAQATSEIAQQVADVQQGVEGAVTSITSMHRTISRISEIATSNATAVEQQGAATREIAHNVMMTSEDTRSISNSVVEITQACAASYASAFKVLWSAQDIEAPVALLRQNIAGFLSNVYAA